MEPHIWLPAAGLIAGGVLGYAARRAHFCTLSALERHWYAGDSRGLRIWVLAGVLAIVFTQALALLGLISPTASFYLQPNFFWVGAVGGGLMFGLGMALVGTCGFGALIRLGGGSLRGLIVIIVIGLTGLATQRGILAPMRRALEDASALDLGRIGSQSIPALAAALLGASAGWILVAAALALLLFWVFSDREFRRSGSCLLTALAIAAAIAAGWLATTLAAANSFTPIQVESASFVAPVADVIMLLGIHAGGGFPDYGVGVVFGVVAGAALAAWQKHDMRWEACDDARELGRHLVGATLMGVGGIFAMGCTIGQGLSAMSLLALSAPVVMVSIAAGARLGLAYLIEGSPLAAFGRPAA